MLLVADVVWDLFCAWKDCGARGRQPPPSLCHAWPCKHKLNKTTISHTTTHNTPHRTNSALAEELPLAFSDAARGQLLPPLTLWLQAYDNARSRLAAPAPARLPVDAQRRRVERRAARAARAFEREAGVVAGASAPSSTAAAPAPTPGLAGAGPAAPPPPATPPGSYEEEAEEEEEYDDDASAPSEDEPTTPSALGAAPHRPAPLAGAGVPAAARAAAAPPPPAQVPVENEPPRARRLHRRGLEDLKAACDRAARKLARESLAPARPRALPSACASRLPRHSLNCIPPTTHTNTPKHTSTNATSAAMMEDFEIKEDRLALLLRWLVRAAPRLRAHLAHALLAARAGVAAGGGGHGGVGSGVGGVGVGGGALAAPEGRLEEFPAALLAGEEGAGEVVRNENGGRRKGVWAGGMSSVPVAGGNNKHLAPSLPPNASSLAHNPPIRPFPRLSSRRLRRRRRRRPT